MVKIFFILIFLSFSANAITTTERERNLSKQLRCLTCEGQSVADSQTEFSASIKSLIAEEIKSGKTDEEIIAKLKSLYGNELFFEPEFSSTTYILWFSPFLIILLGFAGFIILKSKKN